MRKLCQATVNDKTVETQQAVLFDCKETNNHGTLNGS